MYRGAEASRTVLGEMSEVLTGEETPLTVNIQSDASMRMHLVTDLATIQTQATLQQLIRKTEMRRIDGSLTAA
jgi:hypothetical protein